MLLDPPGTTKPWQHFPYNSHEHFAHFASKVLSLGQGEHEEAQIFRADSPDAVCRLLKKIVLVRPDQQFD